MKVKFTIYLLIAIVMVSVKSEEDVTTQKKIESSPSPIINTTTTSLSDSPTKDTKEKRQLDRHQTAIHPHHQHHQHRHQSSDPIYSPSQANNFVIRAFNGNRRPHAQLHQQYLRESSPAPIREQQQNQLQSAEPAQEAAQQQYVYLPESSRGQQQVFRPAHYSKQGPIRKPQSIRPVQLIQDIPQYSPHPYPLIPEDQLLKLLEEELASKGITNVQQNQQHSQPAEQKLIHTQTRKPPQSHQHAVTEGEPQQAGLGNYRQLQQSGPDNLEYVYLQEPQQLQQQQQHQQQLQQPQAQQYYAAPFLQHRPPPPATLNEQSIYASAQTPLDYHKSIPNHPLAASSLEKEIEKLFAPKKQQGHIVGSYDQQQLRYAPQPQYQAYKTPKPQPEKSYGTTPSPTEKQYSFLPSLAEFSGFKQEEAPELELPEQKTRQYLPKAYPTRSQYLKESSANKQSRRPKPQIQQAPLYHLSNGQQQTAQYYSPIQQVHDLQQHHQHQSAQNEFVPISNPNQSKNSAMKLIDPPTLQYQKQRTSPSLFYNLDEQQQSAAEPPQAQHLIGAPHPSHSSIFVAQGTGIRHTTPQPSLPVKAYGAGGKKDIHLPPPNGKPITQEEFQALVDAGYPVQAVPVPVPVPYEKYIKDHPEYKNQLEQQQTASSNQHNSRAAGITYLRPIRDQQNEDELYEKNS